MKQAENETDASYIHLQTNGVTSKQGRHPKLGQKVGLAGDSGTDLNGFHLHFAVSDKPDQTDGFVTIPVAFSDYELRSSGGTWQPIARGVPRPGTSFAIHPRRRSTACRSVPRVSSPAAANLLDLIATDATARSRSRDGHRTAR